MAYEYTWTLGAWLIVVVIPVLFFSFAVWNALRWRGK